MRKVTPPATPDQASGDNEVKPHGWHQGTAIRATALVIILIVLTMSGVALFRLGQASKKQAISTTVAATELTTTTSTTYLSTTTSTADLLSTTSTTSDSFIADGGMQGVFVETEGATAAQQIIKSGSQAPTPDECANLFDEQVHLGNVNESDRRNWVHGCSFPS